MHLHTERKKTFQFLDLIHQTKCALNFNKLLNYKPQQHSTPIRGWLLLLLLWFCSRIWFVSHSGTFKRSAPSRGRLCLTKLDRNLAVALFKTKKNKDYVKTFSYTTWVFIHYLGFPGRKLFSHLLLFSFWVYWLDPHHISGQGLLLFCQARSSLFRRVNTHPWPARLNEPSSPHVPQKCHCVVSPGPFSLPPFLSQHTVWFLYPLSWRCGKEGGKWER